MGASAVLVKIALTSIVCLLWAPVLVSEARGIWAESPPVVDRSDDNATFSSRLEVSEDFIPVKYWVLLHPNASQEEFRGQLYINIKVMAERDNVLLNQRHLNITEVKAAARHNDTGNIPIDILESVRWNDFNHLRIQFNETLPRQTTLGLWIKFSGHIGKAWTGMYYKSHFVSGEERRSIFTNGHTLEMLPCIYHAKPKVTFELFLVHESHQTVVSNFNLKSTINVTQDNWINRTYFHRDERYDSAPLNWMISQFDIFRIHIHALSFAIVEFDHITKNTTEHEVKVFAPPNQISMSQFALNKSVQILDFYFTYHGSMWRHEHKKLDIVSAGNVGGYSTEGLIFMSGANLAYQPGISPPEWEQKTTFELAYHLARLWWGNLKTVPDNDAGTYYVLDGIAAYVANRAMTELYGEEDTKTRYDQWYERIMESDGLYATRAVSSNGQLYMYHRPTYDPVSFQKGALVMRMIEKRVSEGSVKSALQTRSRYHPTRDIVLKGDGFFRTLFENTELEEFNHPDKWHLLRNWFLQNGYPVVTLSRHGNTVNYTQNRFYSNSRWRPRSQERIADAYNIPVDRRNTEWPIPFSYTTSADPEGQTLVWLTERSGTFSVNASSVTWIKGKIEPHSLYRVNYDSSGWKDLQDMITRNHSELPAVQRKSLFSDAFALARGGYLNYRTLLDMTRYVANESDQSVRDEVAKGLTAIRDTVDPNIRFTSSAPYVVKNDQKTMDEYITALKLDPREENRCNCKSPGKSMKDLYTRWKHNSKSSIPAAKMPDVYLYAVMEGEREDWDLVFHRSTKSTQPLEKLMMQSVLGCSPETTQLLRLVKYIMDFSKIDIEHLHVILERMACTRAGRIVLFRFLRQHWENLLETFGGHNSVLLQPIVRTVHSFDSEFDLNEIQEFFRPRQYYWCGAHHFKQQAAEEIRNRLDWRSNFTDVIISWLEENDLRTSLNVTSAPVNVPVLMDDLSAPVNVPMLMDELSAGVNVPGPSDDSSGAANVAPLSNVTSV